LRHEFFHICKELTVVEWTVQLKIEVLLIFIVKCRQADIGSTVLSAVSLTLVKCFSADRYQQQWGKMSSLTLIRMAKDEKGLAFFKGLML
jgi:hypothetical protein